MLKTKFMRNNHEIDYKIFGEELQFVEVELDPAGNGDRGARRIYDDGRRNRNANHFRRRIPATGLRFAGPFDECRETGAGG